MEFKVVITIYNGEKWIKQCVKSLLDQTYTNWQAIIVDDSSTDNTLERIQLFSTDSRISIIANKKRMYKQYNQVNAYRKLYENDEDILCTIDGDDFLIRNDAFQLLQEFYKQQECWATYGSMIKWPSKQKCSQSIFSESQGSARKIPWIFDQLRTYKAFIWKEIKDKDYRDSKGKYFIASSDNAIFRPVLEMCTSKRAKRFPYYIYAWNLDNPLNDGKVHKQEQAYTLTEVKQKKKPYPRYYKSY